MPSSSPSLEKQLKALKQDSDNKQDDDYKKKYLALKEKSDDYLEKTADLQEKYVVLLKKVEELCS